MTKSIAASLDGRPLTNILLGYPNNFLVLIYTPKSEDIWGEFIIYSTAIN